MTPTPSRVNPKPARAGDPGGGWPAIFHHLPPVRETAESSPLITLMDADQKTARESATVLQPAPILAKNKKPVPQRAPATAGRLKEHKGPDRTTTTSNKNGLLSSLPPVTLNLLDLGTGGWARGERMDPLFGFGLAQVRLRLDCG